MAFDFILGSTGTNWSRGIKQLLPDTPDSTSMGGQQPMPSPPQSPGEDSEAYWAKLQRDMENIRQNVWRGSYPMVLDAGSVANMLTSPELTSELMDRTRTVPAASTTTSWPWPAMAAPARWRPSPACADAP